MLGTRVLVGDGLKGRVSFPSVLLEELVWLSDFFAPLYEIFSRVQSVYILSRV